MDMPSPGWYHDPYGARDLLRWWDGSQWTGQTHSIAETQRASPGPADGPGPADSSGPAAWPMPAETIGAAEGWQPSAADSMPAEMVYPAAPEADGTPSAPDAQPATDWTPGGPATDWTAGAPGASWTAPGQAATRAEAQQADNPTSVISTSEFLQDGKIWAPGEPDRPPGRRRRIMWLLAGGTVLAVLVIGILVILIGNTTAVKKTPAALASSLPPASHAPAPSPSATPSSTSSSASPSPGPPAGNLVTDASAGVSYTLLSAPWQATCPPVLNNPAFTWTTGESAVAGTTGTGSTTSWYGNACSGPLTAQYPYGGVGDLEQTATSLVNAFDPAYYNPLPHTRTPVSSDPLQVSGHPAWITKFLITYQNAQSAGLAWQTELGAVVVVDRGAGQPPAVLYVSVPDNLGTGNVDVIASSLQLTGQP